MLVPPKKGYIQSDAKDAAQEDRVRCAQLILDGLMCAVNQHMMQLNLLEERLYPILDLSPSLASAPKEKPEQEIPQYFHSLQVEINNLCDATEKLKGILNRLEI